MHGKSGFFKKHAFYSGKRNQCSKWEISVNLGPVNRGPVNQGAGLYEYIIVAATK